MFYLLYKENSVYFWLSTAINLKNSIDWLIKVGDKMIKLVASDLDGTMFGTTPTISNTNLQAIKDLNQSSINFAICTGKPYAISKDICHNFNANYGIFGNGIEIVDLKTGEVLAKKTLTLEEIQTCLTVAKNYHLHVHLYTDTELITEELMYLDLRNYTLYPNALQFKVVDNISNYIALHNLTITKVILSGISHIADAKKDIEEHSSMTICQISKSGKFKDTIINKEYEYLDISPQNINKNEALQVLSKHLNLTSAEIMSIGDNLNDLDMIKNSGIGVAINNAYDEVKDVASYITQNSADDGGFAEAIYRFVEF